MVCSKCEKKLSRGIHQEMWKDGSRHTIEGGGRKINQNMALSGKKRWTPYGGATGGSKCKICKQSLHQQGIYCQKCAYHHGMCSMCGVKVMDTTFYNMGGESKEAMAARRADEIAATAKEDSDDPTGIDGPKAPEQDEEEKEAVTAEIYLTYEEILQLEQALIELDEQNTTNTLEIHKRDAKTIFLIKQVEEIEELLQSKENTQQ